MVIVKIHYGLGNQLFQYALAKTLSYKLKYSLKLDVSFYDNKPDVKHPRLFLLDKFNIKLYNAGYSDLQKFNRTSFIFTHLERFFNIFKPYYKRKIVYEKSFELDENIFKINNNSYLAGYWQDERYFSEYAGEIKKDLVFKDEPAGLNKILFKEIKANSNSVCIHIRRGDYLSEQTTQQVATCSIQYYQRAVNYVNQKINSPFFYIFSDEPEWVKDNFAIPFPYKVVEHNSEAEAYEDLRLMSACNHQIISNSSFGWWVAWLNNNTDKIVIAPKLWRKNGPDMFLPKEWLRM